MPHRHPRRDLGGADFAVVLAASPAVFDQAYRSLRRGGRLVCVALPADNGALNLPIFDTVINGKSEEVLSGRIPARIVFQL